MANDVSKIANGSTSSLVKEMKDTQAEMMKYQVEMNTTTAMLQAESTAVNQMAKALNTSVQNIRA
ncbi:MAG: hypothetical protein HWE20_00120 [Gammaproteobacteria bacterium]|nr:hypothetical protein [Gammaproteobacteria bacterium]